MSTSHGKSIPEKNCCQGFQYVSLCYRHVVNLSGTSLVIGLTVTIGSFISLPFLVLAEKIVDFWGHSNILIVCFASYILHFTCKFPM